MVRGRLQNAPPLFALPTRVRRTGTLPKVYLFIPAEFIYLQRSYIKIYIIFMISLNKLHYHVIKAMSVDYRFSVLLLFLIFPHLFKQRALTVTK